MGNGMYPPNYLKASTAAARLMMYKFRYYLEVEQSQGAF